MKVILYARVSTDEQAKNGQSLEAQMTKLRQWADLFDHEVVAEIMDPGQSAKSLTRPGLQDALSMLAEGKAGGLVIAKLDRLTRNVGDWQRLIDDLFGEGKGKELFSLGDSIDTQTPGGRLVLNVLLSVAQWEREAIGERTKSALQHKIAKGERCGEVRFGYDVAADGVRLVPNEEEQRRISLIHQLSSQGLSHRKIAEELDRRGVPTKKGAKNWARSTVGNILKNYQPIDLQEVA